MRLLAAAAVALARRQPPPPFMFQLAGAFPVARRPAQDEYGAGKTRGRNGSY